MRLTLSSFGFFSAIFLSPVFVLITAVVLCLRYRAWEVLFMGLFLDLAWLPAGSFLYATPVATIVAVLIVWLLEPLREQLLTD